MDRGWLSCIIAALLLAIPEAMDASAGASKLRLSPFASVRDLNTAIKASEDFVSKLQRLEESLALSGIEVQSNTPSHGQFIDSYPTKKSLTLGKYAMIANRASLYLLQKHCQRLYIRKSDCVKTISKWNMTDTLLGDRCKEQFHVSKCEDSYPYRSYDGSCNHKERPNLGLSSTAYRRLLNAEYADGISLSRRSINGKELPSSRFISSKLISDLNKPEKERTLALVQWTQFIADDLYHTPISKMVYMNKAIECCRSDGRTLTPRYIHPGCQLISIPTDDPDYSPQRTVCMNYVRSLTSLRHDCSFGSADQMNQNTHYLDASTIYGSSAPIAMSLRTMKGGKLLTTNQNGHEFLPPSDAPENDCQMKPNRICYKSGDLRVNQHPHHTAMYTLWVREHNRIAKKLGKINPQWEDETLYQEARKIVVAQIQHITYKYWVPMVLGEKYARENGVDVHTKDFDTSFSEETDPRISNSFATVGLRFINSMYQSELRLYDENGNVSDVLFLKDHFNKPEIVQKPNMLEKLVRGLSCETSQKMDAAFVKDVTNYLFRSRENEMGQDIVSLDIQRGRDHGLPGYNLYRKFCNLSESDKFDGFLDTIPIANLNKIKRLYDHPNDVDLFVGAISEIPKDDSMLGPVFRCIIREQMLRTRSGDRFFYDVTGKSHSFKEGQLREIKKATLSKIICNNVKAIKKIQHDVFRLPSARNPVIDCDDQHLSGINLNEWKAFK